MEADVRQPENNIPTHPSDQVSQHEAIYRALSNYPFHSDPEYLAGLAAILGHPDAPATDEEVQARDDLVVQAKCFYFARKHNLLPIDPITYTTWLRSSSSTLPLPQSSTATSAATTLSPTAPVFTPSFAQSSASASASQPQASSSPPEPPYPTSFAAIVDLITRNIPVPGIEEIPSTVLEPGSSKIDKTPRRRKPWEEAASATTQVETAQVDDEEREAEKAKETAPDTNGHRTTGEGVVNILKPNAVPDSGLLARE